MDDVIDLPLVICNRDDLNLVILFGAGYFIMYVFAGDTRAGFQEIGDRAVIVRRLTGLFQPMGHLVAELAQQFVFFFTISISKGTVSAHNFEIMRIQNGDLVCHAVQNCFKELLVRSDFLFSGLSFTNVLKQ